MFAQQEKVPAWIHGYDLGCEADGEAWSLVPACKYYGTVPARRLRNNAWPLISATAASLQLRLHGRL